MPSPEFQLIQGDCLIELDKLDENSIHSIVTDPPAGISMMSSQIDWDCFRRSRNPADVNRDSVHGRMSAHAPHSYGESDRGRFIEFMTAAMSKCLRVVKPGGYAFVWALPRTAHWTTLAIEDAGWEIRDRITHIYAADDSVRKFLSSLDKKQLQLFDKMLSNDTIRTHIFGNGFPKSLRISKAIDRVKGLEEKIIGSKAGLPGYSLSPDKGRGTYNAAAYGLDSEKECQITEPASQEAAEWVGWGTALKPATEYWILARKPLSESTVADNVLKYGTGAINIDASKVPGSVIEERGETWAKSGKGKSRPWHGSEYSEERTAGERTSSLGRWPANLVVSHHPDCRPSGETKVQGSKPHSVRSQEKSPSGYGSITERRGEVVNYGDENGIETVQNWNCVENCPVRILNEQSGHLKPGGSVTGNEPSELTRHCYGHYKDRRFFDSYGDGGGAARFFNNFHPTDDVDFLYCTKASRKERNAGLGASIQNKHPTVKSLGLCRWLVNMITPPNGTVLDCFCGSGSVGIACVQEGFNFIGIEQDADYIEIAQARIEHHRKNKKRNVFDI